MTLGNVQRLPLRRRLLLGLGLLCVANVIVAVFAVWSLAVLASLTTERLGRAARLARVASQVAEHTLQCRRFEKDLFLNLTKAGERDRYEKQWHQAYAALQAAVAEYTTLAQNDEDRNTAGRWTRLQQDYATALTLVLEGVKKGTIQSPEQANEEITPYKESIRELTDLATTTAHRKMDEVKQVEVDVGQVHSFFKTLILIVTACAVVGSLWWSYRLAGEVTRPIRDLARAADRIAAGDWHVQVPVDGDDELGKLAEALNHLTAQLREKVVVPPNG
jgi:methyl-accepting chemotaxis protein